MSVRIRTLKRLGVVLSGRWEAYIVAKRSNGEVLKERVAIPSDCSSRRAAKEWAEARQAHLMGHGKEELENDSEEKKIQTVAELINAWLETREGLDSEPDDRQRLKDYVIPVLGELNVSELRPKHSVTLVETLKKRKSRKGGKLAPRTIRGTYFLLRQIFDWAVLHEYVVANPVAIPDGVLPEKKDKDPRWRSRARFTRDEVERLITDTSIPKHRRMAYALEFLTGLRTGEASALRWQDYQAGYEPLGKLLCAESYNTRHKKAKETKTEVPREIPVHPVLAKMLATWKLSGWAVKHGRKPKPEDLIIPSTKGAERHRRVNYALKEFLQDLAALGLNRRRHYDSRRTFISLAIDGGASKDVLRYITHPSAEDAFDLYKTPSWQALCEAVLCLKATSERGRVVELDGQRAAAEQTTATGLKGDGGVNMEWVASAS